MAVNPAILIESARVTNAAASIGGPTSPTKWLLKRTVFTNTDTTARSITVYRVPSGGTPVSANIVIDAQTLQPAGETGCTYVAVELADMVLNPGDKLYALADVTNVVNVTASGFTF